jgi:hypothetical protein
MSTGVQTAKALNSAQRAWLKKMSDALDAPLKTAATNGRHGSAAGRPGAVPEIDEMRSSLQAVFRDTILKYENADFIAEARRLNEKLFDSDDVVGPAEKSATAETLIQMHREMERRIQEAASKQMKWPPAMKGVEWKANDPLAPLVESISPFGMIDQWQGFLIQPQGGRHQRASARPRGKSAPDKAPTPGASGPETPPQPVEPQQPRVKQPDHARGLPPAPKRGPDMKDFPRPSLSPQVEPPALAVILGLVKNLFLARTRGIEEAAWDVSIYVYAAGLANMAINAPADIHYTLPEPDYRLIRPILEERMRNAAEWKQQETARQIHAKAIDIGLKAAKECIRKLDEKSATAEVRAIRAPDGRWVRCQGLECARPDSIVIQPAQGHCVNYLRYLKATYKTEVAIYGQIVKELSGQGVAPKRIRL